MENRYWLTPPQIYKELDREFNFQFDPCPCPRPEGYNSLSVPWSESNYVNPPFNFKGGSDGPTSFVHKGIAEQAKGNSSVFLLPVRHYINLLMEAGAEYRSMGRVKWLEVDTKEPWKSPIPIGAFILKGHSPKEE